MNMYFFYYSDNVWLKEHNTIVGHSDLISNGNELSYGRNIVESVMP